MDSNNSSINVKILTGAHSHLGTEWKFKNDSSSFARLYYIKSGSAYLYRDAGTIKLLPGKLYLIEPNSNFSAGCMNKVEILWIHFTFDFFSSIPIFTLAEFECECRPPDKSLAESAIKKLVSLYSETDLKKRLEAVGILLQILSLFVEKEIDFSRPEKNQAVRFVPIFDYIDKHCKEKIRISELAKRASLERAYFSNLFSETFGLPVKKYILRKKIENAKTMLLKNNIKIDDCGREFGFNDGFHFSKTFKKITGLSPLEFIKSRGTIIP